MPFSDILGQDAAVGTLRRALATGRIHHAYRFEGPPGVGKEMAAFALAQALVCTEAPPPGHAFGTGCGACSACKRAVTFSANPAVPLHPDVIVVERGLYPREIIGKNEVQSLSIEQIRRVVMERTSLPPHEGRARVFLLRRPEEMSVEAANALLKTLEEPLSRTYFILLTDRGSELLDTIRSRTQLVRFAPLSEAILERILVQRGVAQDEAKAAAELAAGSASLALALANPEASKGRKAFVDAVLAAVKAKDMVPAMELAEARERDKGELSERLAALAATFARLAREKAAENPDEAARHAERYALVLQAMREIDRNASPALVLEAMVARLRRVA